MTTPNRSLTPAGRRPWPLLAALLLFPALAGAAPAPPPAPRVDPRVDAAAAADPSDVGVILLFRGTPAAPARAADEVARLAKGTAAGERFVVRRVYAGFPAAAVRVSAARLARLRRDEGIVAITPDGRVRAFLEEGVPLIRADRAHLLGTRGAGQTVAVIDTGIDYRHAELGGTAFPNGKVIGGYDLANDDDDPRDDEGHGTAVAGIVASSRGVAPDAKLVALKALDSDGSGTDSDILAAVDWAILRKGQYGISVINLSLGGDAHRGTCDTIRPEYAAAFAAAANAGILVVAASGNEAHEDEVAEPACVSTAIAVGGVYDADGLGGREYCNAYDPLGIFCIDELCEDSDPDADEVACYSNAGDALDLLAPSHDCRTTKRGGGWMDDFGGTSAATPYAAGSVALVLEAANAPLSPAAMTELLGGTGVPVKDRRSGRSWPRLDVEAAVRAAGAGCTAPPAPANLRGPAVDPPAGSLYTVSWDAVDGATGYELEESRESEPGLVTERRESVATEATFSHVTAGEGWLYRVRATRACGPGEFSSRVTVRIAAAGGPGSAPFSAVVAGAGHLPGAGGTVWRTALSVFNPSPSPVTATLWLLGAGGSATTPPASVVRSIPAGGVLATDDAVALFTAADASGALVVDAPSILVVESTTSNTAGTGTFGQGFPARPTAAGLVAGRVADLVGLRSSGTFRTNLGVANPTATTQVVRWKLFDAAGAELASWTRTVAPFSQAQDNDVAATLGAWPGAELRAEGRLEAGAGPVHLFASVIDRRSGDPVAVMGAIR